MVDNKVKEDCCGCRACEQICPKHAIRMVEDEKGFRYPVIDYSLCNKCGLCDAVCAFNENYNNYGDNPAVYAVKHKDETVRSTSTSGGMFTAISDKILEEGGVVYGAGYKDRLYVCHKRASTRQARDEFKGSKYVQSDIGNTFTNIKTDLENGLRVLFTGTPCQVAGLKSFLRKEYDNLITVDFVCHGTPSNKMWQNFIDVIEQDTKNRVIHAEFRNKELGWHRPRTRLHLNKACTMKIKGEHSYFELFSPNYMLMPSCYNCKFSNFKRPGDITIADFWGIERTMPDFDDDKGVSLVLVNSPKGDLFFDSIRKGLTIKKSSKENCLQGTLVDQPERHAKSDQFWCDYHRKGMRYVMTKYTEYSRVRTFVKKAIRKIKRVTKQYVKKATF